MREHCLAMTEQCYSEEDVSCVFNGTTKSGEENHCVVGALLVGIELSIAENVGGLSFILENFRVKNRIGGCTSELLRECQGVHDEPDNWGEKDSVEVRAEAFDTIAQRYNLKSGLTTDASQAGS